jgi:hypothetical protein
MSLCPRYGGSTPIVAYTPWREIQDPTVGTQTPRHFAVRVGSWLARVSQWTGALLRDRELAQHCAAPRMPHPMLAPLAGIFMLIVEDEPASARVWQRMRSDSTGL